MGLGDVLMSMGEAKRFHKAKGQRVLIAGRDGRPVVSDLFDNVPYIISKTNPASGPYKRLINGPGVRPYIATKSEDKWGWQRYRPEPADLVFTPTEVAFAEPYRGRVLVEPTVKPQRHTNKAWPAISWQQLVLKDKKIPWVQCGPAGTRWLQGVTPIVTPTFRHALAVLSVCKAAVLTEGGLHHGAAAVRVPAVVIFGAFISPEVTGYDAHANIFTGAGLGCGARTNCEHCRSAMTKITPAMVLEKLKGLL